jgi:hypothetical protein
MEKFNGLITAEQKVPNDSRSILKCMIKTSETMRFADLHLRQHQNNLHMKE